MSFVHLHVHSYYSFLDGLARITDLIHSAKAMNQSAIALTDHGYFYGALPFYRAALDAGVKPIFGIEFYYHPVSRFEKSLGAKEQERHHHLTVLAMNTTGYKNLMKLATIAATEGFYYKPRIDDEVLSQYREGLIVLSGCPQGYIPSLILNDKLNQAREQILKYKAWFGDNFYLEIQNHPIFDAASDPNFARQYADFAPREAKIRYVLRQLSKELKVPLVATNDVHYVKPSDFKIHDVFYAMQLHAKLDDPNRRRYPADSFYLASAEEMQERFPKNEFPGAITNTIEIAEKCNVVIDALDDAKSGRYHFPVVTIPPAYQDAMEYLEQKVYDGLLERGIITNYPHKLDAYYDRIQYELDVIRRMGFASFFLVMSDTVQWAKSQGIPVGPGRGSAAGSLVSYLLNITDIDPIQHGLLFERFLNPDRVSMPDIDVDYCQDRRDEVIAYTRQKYGQDRVAHIGTINILKLRGAIQKVAMTVDIDPKEVDRFTKSIPPDTETLEELFEKVPQAKQAYETKPKLRQCVDLALHYIGMPSNPGVHAAGIVIADKPLDEYVACKREDNVLVTQATMEDIESLGLLKMDFLGLRTLTFLKHAANIVKQRHGIDIDFASIPLDDLRVYQTIYHADSPEDLKVDGIFQVESYMMRKLLVDIKPKNIYDLALIIALCRPGPLDAKMPGTDKTLVEEYVDRRRAWESGVTSFSYPHPLAEAALKETLGIMVYQEQIMQLSIDMAGYTKGESDQLRKIIGKKLMEKMPEQREKFISGCVRKGVPLDVATAVFDQIEEFGRYSFNKSHSLSYAVVSYYTAYMKTYYPAEFMAALLTSVQDDQEKTAQYIEHAKRLGLKVLGPNVLTSDVSYTVTQDGVIQVGLASIKYVSQDAAKNIIENRPFTSVADFIVRTDSRLVNRRVIEALVKAGALDSLGMSRAQILAGLDTFYKEWKRVSDRVKRIEAKLSIGGVSDLHRYQEKLVSAREELRQLQFPMTETASMSANQQYQNEIEVLGYSLFDPFEYRIERYGMMHFMAVQKAISMPSGTLLYIRGLVQNMRSNVKGKLAATASLVDPTGKITLLIPKGLNDTLHVLSKLSSTMGPHVVWGQLVNSKTYKTPAIYGHMIWVYPDDIPEVEQPALVMVDMAGIQSGNPSFTLRDTWAKVFKPGDTWISILVHNANGILRVYEKVQLPIIVPHDITWINILQAGEEQG